MTLLEKAKLAPTRKYPTMPEDMEKLELAVAWALTEITLLQASQVLGRNANGTSTLCNFLLKAVRAGLLVRP